MLLQNNAHFNVLERSLHAATLRQKIIANNIANVDTPFFKRSNVEFEQLLQKEMSANASSNFVGYRTNPRHIPIGNSSLQVQPTVTTDKFTSMNNNQNNVDIDFEMSLMAKNQLRYDALIGQVNHELRQIRTAIDGRR